MLLTQFGDRICLAGLNGAQKFLGLTVNLFGVGMNG
jgi:hypothetical protein